MKYEPILIEKRAENRDRAHRIIQYPFAVENVKKAILNVFQYRYSYEILSDSELGETILVRFNTGLYRYNIALTINNAWDKYTNIEIDISNRGFNLEFRNFKHGLLVDIVGEITYQLQCVMVVNKISIYNTWDTSMKEV